MEAQPLTDVSGMNHIVLLFLWFLRGGMGPNVHVLFTSLLIEIIVDRVIVAVHNPI